MFIHSKGTIRELNDKEVIRCFLKQLHLRQNHHLAKVPKILSCHDWEYTTNLSASFRGIDRTVCIPQLEHEIIIPIVNKILFRIERKVTDCDAIIFHTIPLPKSMTGCVESLDGMSARIVTAVDYEMSPLVASQIDIAFTPMWLKRTTEKCSYHVSEE